MTSYLVVLYLLTFKLRDLEAASLLKQLLENTRNEVALSQSDADMLRLLVAGLSLKQLEVVDLSKASKFLKENLSESNPDPLSLFFDTFT